MCSQEQLARIRLDIQCKICAPRSNGHRPGQIFSIKHVLHGAIGSLDINCAAIYVGCSSNLSYEWIMGFCIRQHLHHQPFPSIRPTIHPMPSLYFSLYPNCGKDRYTGCSLKMVVFRKSQNIFRTLASLGFSSVCTPDFMLSAAAQLAELRKITRF